MTDEARLKNDEIFGPSVRFTIMLILYTHKDVAFSILQNLLQLTPGNLDHHLKKLAEKGYVKLLKRFSFRRPITIITSTAKGKKALKRYIQNFRQVLEHIDF